MWRIVEAPASTESRDQRLLGCASQIDHDPARAVLLGGVRVQPLEALKEFRQGSGRGHEVLASLAQGLALEQALGNQLGVAGDNRERLPELVWNRAGELLKSRHTRILALALLAATAGDGKSRVLSVA